MIQTKYHGEIEINEKEIIHFAKGLPGFPDEKEFIILPLSDDGFFSIMQSITTPYVGFVVSSPFNFIRDYEFKLEDAVAAELGIKTEKDVIVLSILSVGDPFEKTTANMQAPVIINSANHQAKQVILNDGPYQIKQSIFQKG